MRSENAKQVARDIIDAVRKGKKVNKGDIIEANGYSKATSTVPTQVTNTKSYQSVMQPFIENLTKERERALSEMMIKDLDKVQYAQLVSALDTMTKNIQLLSGKETEIAGVNISVINYGDDSAQV